MMFEHLAVLDFGDRAPRSHVRSTGQGQRRSEAGKVTAGLAESSGSFLRLRITPSADFCLGNRKTSAMVFMTMP